MKFEVSKQKTSHEYLAYRTQEFFFCQIFLINNYRAPRGSCLHDGSMGFWRTRCVPNVPKGYGGGNGGL